jgi:hypothetical protein
MAVSGKTKEIVEALLLPHETRGATIGSADVVLASINMTSNFKCLLIYDSTISDAEALKCRTLVRWLMRPTGHSLKQLATPDKHIFLVNCKPADEDTILNFLENGGSSLHVFSGWSDIISSSILLCVRAILHRIDETNSNFRTSLSAEVERLDNIGVFSTSATGEMKDTILLASWVARRLLRKFGEIENLDTLIFDGDNPSSVSPLVDEWVDNLFGEDSEFHGIDMLQLSAVCNDLIIHDINGRVFDGGGNSLALNLNMNNSGGKASEINLGSFTSAVKSNANTKLIYTSHGVIPPPNSQSLVREAIVSLNLDRFDGARIKVADEACCIGIEIYSKTFNTSQSGKDSVRGSYNPIRNEWVYTDDSNNIISTPSLEEPFYSVGNANFDPTDPINTILHIPVFRRNSPSPIPPPTWREFILILEYQGQVSNNFFVSFKQFDIQPPWSPSPKWPCIGALSENINFLDWQPKNSTTAVYSIRLLNHTLWDLDAEARLDPAQYASMTASYGAFKSFSRKIFSKLLYTK